MQTSLIMHKVDVEASVFKKEKEKKKRSLDYKTSAEKCYEVLCIRTFTYTVPKDM